MDFVVDVIFDMLKSHPNASVILARTASRLGFEEIIWGQVPGLDMSRNLCNPFSHRRLRQMAH